MEPDRGARKAIVTFTGRTPGLARDMQNPGNLMSYDNKWVLNFKKLHLQLTVRHLLAYA